jgi:hypothetical protein
MIRTAFTTDRQKFRRSQGNDAMKGPWVFHPPGKRKPVAGYVYIAVSKRGFCFLVEASDRRSLEGLIYRISGFKSKGQARECMTKILAKLGISASMIQ